MFLIATKSDKDRTGNEQLTRNLKPIAHDTFNIDIDIDIDIFITPNISMRNTIQFQHINNIKKVFKWMTIKKTIFTKVVRL